MKKGAYKHLNLTHLEAALPQVLEAAQREQWTYETLLERALAAELEGREQQAIARRLKAARIPSKKTVDGFDFSFQPTLSERRLRELADLSFVRTCTNVVFLGPPGTGKTHLSLALADRALTAGYSVLFTTLAELAQALESASHPGLVRQRLRRYIAPNLLGDEVLATALLDRLLHHAEVIPINGRSYRMKERQADRTGLSAPPEVALGATGAKSTGVR
jgi:DNA replication protein DnaC